MSELRREPVLHRWVVIASQSWLDITDLLEDAKRKQKVEPCPFCDGREMQTPPEVFAIRDPSSGRDQRGWRVRVVPNKFPFLRIEGDFDRRGEGIYDRMNGIGAHEIVIEMPEHTGDWATKPAGHIRDILYAYRERVLDLRKDPRFRQIVIAKNHGPGLAILPHPHSHIVALPIIPRRIEDELRGTADYYQRKERCVHCDMIKQELSSRSRIVIETKGFLVFCPYASRYPFELIIIPKTHIPDYGSIEDGELLELAGVMKETFDKLKKLLKDPPFSFVFHSTPVQNFYEPRYHWHIEIRTRIPISGGFEWGTGFFVNPISPEDSARLLREVH
ncbi:MAG: galactose-1-phosphate uridylyltransferase [Candidatus Aenigmatarchaeota archaeon]